MLNKSGSWAAILASLLLSSLVLADGRGTSGMAVSNWIGTVLIGNPDVQAGQAAVDAALARASAADQPLFNPELEFDYERTDINISSLGLSQTIDWSNKRGAHKAIAEVGVRTARVELSQRRQLLAAELLSKLSAFQAAGELEKIARSGSQLMTRFADLSQRRWEAGDVGQIELDLARLATAEADFALASASSQRIIQKQALRALAGLIQIDVPMLPELPPLIESAERNKESLMAALPSVQSTRARMDSARSEVDLRPRETRPDPTVGFRIGKEDQESLAGVTLSIPLFVRNTFNAEVEAANADLIQAQQEALNTQRQTSARYDASAQRYQVMRDSWQVWKAGGQASLDPQSSVLERLWRAGELSTTDYLVQVKQVMETQAGAIEQHGQMWQAWVEWLIASGQVEQWLNLSGAQ